MKHAIVAVAAALISWPLAAADAPEDFRARLSEFIGPDLPIGAISETPLADVYEVTAGNRVLYVAMKDELILVGSLYDTERGVNLGEEKQNEITRRMAEEEIGKLSVDDMVVFKGDESKRHITVFTDVECGYCRRLHQEVPQLNEAGIEVRYLAYPVISQNSYPNAVSVWCADDQQTAMTQAKLGRQIESRTCDNPVDAQLELGRKLGVRGTPFLVLDDFSVIPGYVPAKELIRQMGL